MNKFILGFAVGCWFPGIVIIALSAFTDADRAFAAGQWVRRALEFGGVAQ